MANPAVHRTKNTNCIDNNVCRWCFNCAIRDPNILCTHGQRARHLPSMIKQSQVRTLCDINCVERDCGCVTHGELARRQTRLETMRVCWVVVGVRSYFNIVLGFPVAASHIIPIVPVHTYLECASAARRRIIPRKKCSHKNNRENSIAPARNQRQYEG